MRTKLSFEVYGSTKDDLVRRAYQVVSDFLGSEDLSPIADIEMDVSSILLNNEETTLFNSESVNNFSAKVYVKFKFDK